MFGEQHIKVIWVHVNLYKNFTWSGKRKNSVKSQFMLYLHTVVTHILCRCIIPLYVGIVLITLLFFCFKFGCDLGNYNS